MSLFHLSLYMMNSFEGSFDSSEAKVPMAIQLDILSSGGNTAPYVTLHILCTYCAC